MEEIERRGLFEQDSINPTKVNTKNMFGGLESRYRKYFECAEDYETHGWAGCGLPFIPCVELYNCFDALIVTPKQAIELIKARQNNNDEDIAIYTDVYGFCGYYDMYLGNLTLYVVDSKDILDQDEKEVKADYEEYKTAVLDMIKNADEESKDYFYREIISDELLRDEEFIEEATKYDSSIKEMAENREKEIIEEKNEEKNEEKFVRLVNQLRLKRKASFMAEGTDRDIGWTAFDKKINDKIFENEKYKRNPEEDINKDNFVRIGLMDKEYGVSYDDYGKNYDFYYRDGLYIEQLDDGYVRLIKMNIEENGALENPLDENIYACAVIGVEKLQEFCDTLPLIYPELPEEMISEGEYYDYKGKYSEDKVREFMKIKHEIKDVEEVIEDRTITGLNKTVENIQEEKGENNKKKNKKDIVDDE